MTPVPPLMLGRHGDSSSESVVGGGGWSLRVIGWASLSLSGMADMSYFSSYTLMLVSPSSSTALAMAAVRHLVGHSALAVDPVLYGTTLRK